MGMFAYGGRRSSNEQLLDQYLASSPMPSFPTADRARDLDMPPASFDGGIPAAPFGDGAAAAVFGNGTAAAQLGSDTSVGSPGDDILAAASFGNDRRASDHGTGDSAISVTGVQPIGLAEIARSARPAPVKPDRAQPNLRGFPDEVVAGALETQRKWRVPASVTLAQWAFESGWGKKTPPNSNNYFGIKAIGNQPYVMAPTREQDKNHKFYTIQGKFRTFASRDEAFDAHAKVLLEKRYAAARAKLPDVDAYVDLVGKAYGTNGDYASHIKKMIHRRRLQALDD